VAAGWLRLVPMERSDWREVSRLRGIAVQDGEAVEDPTETWLAWDRRHLPAPRPSHVLRISIVCVAALSPISTVSAYAGVAEVEIYVAPKVRRCGIARRLLARLVSETEHCGIWSLQAAIIRDAGPGLYLHRRCGFRVIGTRERVALVRGEWRGELLMERRSKVVQAHGELAAAEAPDTPESKTAREKAVQVLAPIFLEVAIKEAARAKVLGIGVSDLRELYRRGDRSRDDDNRLIETIRAERAENRKSELLREWDDDVRTEIERRKREGLLYQYILAYFDRPE